MKEGWSAKGLLRPLWQFYPGKRDGLAHDIGTSPSTLSAINSGRRNLGYDLGRRIADALDVSLLELGAPEDAADQKGRTLTDRLEELAADLAEAARAMSRLQERVKRLEARAWPGEGRPKGRGGN